MREPTREEILKEFQKRFVKNCVDGISFADLWNP
jgi:hypothetical protein